MKKKILRYSFWGSIIIQASITILFFAGALIKKEAYGKYYIEKAAYLSLLFLQYYPFIFLGTALFYAFYFNIRQKNQRIKQKHDAKD